MTVNLRNLTAQSVTISAEPPPPVGIFTIEDNGATDSTLNYTVYRGGSNSGSASVDWAMTTNAYDPLTSVGAYVPLSDGIYAGPTDWDEPNSGWIVGTDESDSATFPNVLANKAGTLASAYDGANSRYDADFAARLFFFTYPSPVTISSFAIDADSDFQGSPAFKYYETLTGNEIRTYYDEGDPSPGVEILNGRKYFTWTFPSPITVQSILVTGFFGYPQGRPYYIYGVLNDFEAATSGTATFGNRAILYNIDAQYAWNGNSPTADDVTIVLSNPVNGTIGTPSTATNTIVP